MLTTPSEALSAYMCCVLTQNRVDAYFHHSNVNRIWLNYQSYFEGWFCFMHKTQVGFYKQKHSFKSSWGPLQRWRDSKMTHASKTWVSWACAGSSGHSTPQLPCQLCVVGVGGSERASS